MFRLTVAAAALALLAPRPLAGDDTAAKRGGPPGRAEQLKAIRADYQAALAEMVQAIRAGQVKAAPDGTYRELSELRGRFARRARALIDADPKDEVAFDAILFSMRDLVADAEGPKLYGLLLAHHLGRREVGSVAGRPYADEAFLRAVADKSPHAEARARATLGLAERLVSAGRPEQAESLLEKIIQDKEWAKFSHHRGSLGKGAEDLLFEARHLSVGKAAPEIEGNGLDGKPMKLSDYRGKAVLLVWWATWCGPCMAMVPHERELAKRYAGRPFAVVGVNGDGGPEEVKKRWRGEAAPWRSFWDAPQGPISRRWNVDAWPTVYLLDHAGVIRRKFRGAPEAKELDEAIEKLVAAAEAGPKKPGKK
jgi:thiol-disulfide isomerase/thioredoxin